MRARERERATITTNALWNVLGYAADAQPLADEPLAGVARARHDEQRNGVMKNGTATSPKKRDALAQAMAAIDAKKAKKKKRAAAAAAAAAEAAAATDTAAAAPPAPVVAARVAPAPLLKKKRRTKKGVKALREIHKYQTMDPERFRHIPRSLFAELVRELIDKTASGAVDDMRVSKNAFAVLYEATGAFADDMLRKGNALAVYAGRQTLSDGDVNMAYYLESGDPAFKPSVLQ